MEDISDEQIYKCEECEQIFGSLMHSKIASSKPPGEDRKYIHTDGCGGEVVPVKPDELPGPSLDEKIHLAELKIKSLIYGEQLAELSTRLNKTLEERKAKKDCNKNELDVTEEYVGVMIQYIEKLAAEFPKLVDQKEKEMFGDDQST